jgi:hypothetical protein
MSNKIENKMADLKFNKDIVTSGADTVTDYVVWWVTLLHYNTISADLDTKSGNIVSEFYKDMQNGLGPDKYKKKEVRIEPPKRYPDLNNDAHLRLLSELSMKAIDGLWNITRQ